MSSAYTSGAAIGEEYRRIPFQRAGPFLTKLSCRFDSAKLWSFVSAGICHPPYSTPNSGVLLPLRLLLLSTCYLPPRALSSPLELSGILPLSEFLFPTLSPPFLISSSVSKIPFMSYCQGPQYSSVNSQGWHRHIRFPNAHRL